ncbi:slipin family protein [Streptomyces sp. NPDC050560]|uniref:slipin family protein n=1 Tax=Streptomyces sp. NPDC050560 TaxID=3365630 RepID=UPI00378AD5A2
MEALIAAIIAVAAVLVVLGLSASRVVKQYERGIVLRLGRLRPTVRGPGYTLVIPGVDRLRKVNMQIVTLPVPTQEGITRDNVTVRVDAVVYFKVVDPAAAVIEVEDYRFAVSQMAQTSLRSIIGKSDLDDLLSNREKLNQGLELMIDSPAVGWGVQVDRVEIKDVSLPETMKRSMARQAEADRERRARVINADAEVQASRKLAEAARQMAATPAALQLRLLETVVAVAAEKNSTLVLPFPVELLRFLEHAQQSMGGQAAQPPAATAGTGATTGADSTGGGDTAGGSDGAGGTAGGAGGTADAGGSGSTDADATGTASGPEEITSGPREITSGRQENGSGGEGAEGDAASAARGRPHSLPAEGPRSG